MKAVLISIQPKWCELIAVRDKSLEIRKTRPKLDLPFKVYIYCTADAVTHIVFDEYGDRQIELVPQSVIGEFVCDKVFLWNHDIHDEDTITLEEACELSCLSEDALLKYAGGYFYGWYISELQIYDKPKELCEFRKPCDSELYCESCGMYHNNTGNCGNAALKIIRPPQSWCYVEEMTT